jgi:putative flavoprotein involved in K+ transport
VGRVPRDEQLRREAAGWVGCGVELPAGRPGLYFVGLPFLYAFASMLVGGVGRDAEWVAAHIAARTAAAQQDRSVTVSR